ncbi:MAG: MerR family transcriptional regulator [Actinobacteria bacterium]|nr:MerR family transcriptional regulator [Actinomycetota bacterium]
MTISELAGEFGIAPSAIRYYEEVGLLSPHRDSPRSQRLYDERDRARLKLILRGRRFGYSLSELADILALYDADPTQEKQIVRTLEYGFRHIREIDERIEELLEIRGEMLEFARDFLAILQRKGGGDGGREAFLEAAGKVIAELEEREFGPVAGKREGPGKGPGRRPVKKAGKKAGEKGAARGAKVRDRGSAGRPSREG